MWVFTTEGCFYSTSNEQCKDGELQVTTVDPAEAERLQEWLGSQGFEFEIQIDRFQEPYWNLFLPISLWAFYMAQSALKINYTSLHGRTEPFADGSHAAYFHCIAEFHKWRRQNS